jgi:hypothetical protein
MSKLASILFGLLILMGSTSALQAKEEAPNPFANVPSVYQKAPEPAAPSVTVTPDFVPLPGGAVPLTLGRQLPTSVPRESAVSQLLEKHNESPISMGIAANGNVMEVFSSPDGETWTIIMTNPKGQSMLVGAGENWIKKKPVKKGSSH